MDNSEENSMLFKLLKINLIRKAIIKHIPSFSDINNLVNVCEFMKCDLEKENIERSILSYRDFQTISVKNDHVCEYDTASDVIRLINFKFTKFYCSKSLRDRLRTFFGEILHNGNCVWSSIDLSIKEWKEENYVPFIQKLIEELNLNCATRKDVRNLKFKFKFRDNADYIILDVLSHIKHDNIKRISLPVKCFTCLSNKYNVINCNIFNGFPNLTELSLNFSFSRSDYYDLTYHKDIFERFVQQFSIAKNPTILFESLAHEDAMRANELYEIINTITKYNVKVKLKVNIECYKFIGECEECTDTMGFFSPVKQYITTVYDSITDYRRLLHSVEILKTFENLSTLHLNFTLSAITSSFIPSYNQKLRGFGLRKLNNLKSVKLECIKRLDYLNSDILNLFYQFFDSTCSMMPRNVEVLQLIRVPDMDNVMAKMITKYMPNIKLLMIECLSYKERDSLDNFSKLECLISCNYCPIRIPRTLKLLAFVFVYGHWAVKSDDLVFTDNVIKSHYEKFTKRISNNSDARDRYILFNDIYYWHLYKYVIQKYFNY